MKEIVSSFKDYRIPIKIGWSGENNARTIKWDITEWVETYGAGTATLIHMRSGDPIPYPCIITIDEQNMANWVITSGDLGDGGYGKCQLIYKVGDQIVAKSPIYQTVADKSLGVKIYEDNNRDWINEALDAKAQAMQVAQEATEAAERAAASETAAAQSAQAAEAVAEQVATYQEQIVQDVLAALPVYNGEVETVG